MKGRDEMMETNRTRINLWVVPAIVLLLCFSLACNLLRLVTNSSAITSTIGVQGGEIAGPDGLQLKIPEGALMADVKFTIQTEAEPPSGPAALTSLSPAYSIELENEAALLIPVTLEIPFTPDPAIPEDCYSVYRWNGADWENVGGIMDGNKLIVDVLHFSTYQAKACSQSEHRPVVFIDTTPKNYPDYRYSGITPWDATLVDETCGGQIRRLYSSVNRSGVKYFPNTWGSQAFPWGEYYLWCVVWSEPDLNSNLMVRYNMYVESTIHLGEGSCKLGDWISGKCEPDQVVYTLPGLGAGTRGECGEDQGQSGVLGPIPQLSSAQSATQTASITQTPLPIPSSTLSFTATPGFGTLTIRTYIDGRSQLIVHGNSVYFYHIDYAAPGAGYAHPNYVNGAEWYPTWPEPSPSYNRDCKCYSSALTGIAPLARQDQTVAMTVIESRDADQITIVQQPSSSNDYMLIVDIYDYSAGGGWYEFTLSYLSGE